jgi:hypothetical protein
MEGYDGGRSRPMKALSLEFLKDRYDFELERKERLTDALTLPVAVLTVLGGLIAVMARSFTYGDTVLTWVFLGLVTADTVAFAVCLVYLAQAYYTQVYVYLPSLKDLRQAENDLQEFYEAAEMEPAGAQEDFNASLEERIIEATDANTRSNDQRSFWLHGSRVALLVVLGLTALAGVPYIVDQVRK